MALYDDNTDKKVLIAVIDQLQARIAEMDKTLASKDELINVNNLPSVSTAQEYSQSEGTFPQAPQTQEMP